MNWWFFNLRDPEPGANVARKRSFFLSSGTSVTRQILRKQAQRVSTRMGLSSICTPVDGGGSVKEMTEELECHQTTISLCLSDGAERDIIEPGWELLNEECRAFIKDVTRVIHDIRFHPRRPELRGVV